MILQCQCIGGAAMIRKRSYEEEKTIFTNGDVKSWIEHDCSCSRRRANRLAKTACRR